MKRLFKTSFIALMSLAATAGMSACGDKFDGLTINFWHTFGKTPADAIEAKAQDFAKLVEQNEGVKLRVKFTYKGGYSDMVGLVNKSFASGETPTIAVAYPDHVADYFAAEKTPGQYVVDLSKFVNDPAIGFGKEAYLGDNHGADDFVQSFYEEGSCYSKEGLYSLPYMKSTEVMFYNKELLQKAMVEIGSEYTSEAEIDEYLSDISWDDFMTLCEEINDANDQGQIKSGAFVPAFYDSDGNFIISKMFQNGIGYASVNSDGKGIIDFNGVPTDNFTPSAEQTQNYNKLISMVTDLKAQYDKGLFYTKGTFGKYGSNEFTAQRTIFSIGSSGGAGYNFPSTKEFHVGICKVPSSNNNPLYVSQGPSLCVFNTKESNNDDLVKYAWKFLKYITNDQVNAELCVNGSEGYIPVRQSAYNTSLFVNFMKNGEEYAKTAETVIHGVDGNYFNAKVFQGSAALREYIGGALADALLAKGGMTVEQAINNAISETIKRM